MKRTNTHVKHRSGSSVVAWSFMVSLAAVPASALGAPSPALVDPEVSWEEGDPGTCVFSVSEEAPSHPVGTPVEVAAGSVTVQVTCPGNEALWPLPVTVKARAGQTAKPKIRLQGARLQIASRRGGVMLGGEAWLYPVNGDLDQPPVARVPTNSRTRVAAGTYDVRVRLTKSDPPAEVRLRRLRIRPGRNADVEVDLSDGGLVARATENGAKVEGSVKVTRPGSTRRVAVGDTGQELRLPAGRYEVTVELRSAANFATDTHIVWIEPGKTAKASSKFSTGKLALTVVQDNKSIPATVRLSLPNASDFFNFFEAPGQIVLTPGRYDASIVADAAKPLGALVRKNIEVKARRTSKVRVDLSQATLTVVVTKNGRPTDARVVLREPGGGVELTAITGGTARVWPGRYELVATLPDGSEQVDGPFDVALGQRIRRKLGFERAKLEVVALRGPAPESAATIFVFRPGAAKPIAKGTHAERMELPVGTYDLKVVAGADTVWKQGVQVRRDTKVRVALPELADADALPEGEAPAEDFVLPEGDAD